MNFTVNEYCGDVNVSCASKMDTMINVWAVVEHVRVASGAAELAIFTAILYWFFTSSRVADMLEVVGERVGGWCGREASAAGAAALRQAVRARRRHQHSEVYQRLDAEKQVRHASLYRMKEEPTVPPPQPPLRPPAGLACARCAPLSRESWHDPQAASDGGAVINVLDIGKQTFANGGVVSRYLCDLAQCCHLVKYDYKDVVPDVVKDDRFQSAIEETTRRELDAAAAGGDAGSTGSPGGAGSTGGAGAAAAYARVKRRVEQRAMRVLMDISSAMSSNVLRFVAWACHKAIRRVARGGCSSRVAGVARLRRAHTAGLPLIFVPLHRSHFDYILVTFTLYLTGLRPPLVAAGDNMRIPFFGWFLRGCGAFYIKRRTDGAEDKGSDPVYKSALRAYILNSLAAKNNLEFFIEGGRTRTGKPQPPKAGILSVILDAYLDGAIEDALLVPVTLNYDRLVDGNFVREQLGRPKQMETFWSALRGIWRTLNTDHGHIRVDFNQPISLKELVTSFQQYAALRPPSPAALGPPTAPPLGGELDRQLLCSSGQSSLSDGGAGHRMLVEAIGRHLVYDAAQSTALTSTNVVAYVLLAELRGGAGPAELCAAIGERARRLAAAGRDLAFAGEPRAVARHALEMLGRGLVTGGGGGRVAARAGIAPALELAYYAGALCAHYAAPAVVATAAETLMPAEHVTLRELLAQSLRLAAVLGHEFLLAPPCRTVEELLLDTVDSMPEVLERVEESQGLEEQVWSRRLARRLEEEDMDAGEPRPDPAAARKYRLLDTPAARAERRRLLLGVRPLLEAYAATVRCVRSDAQRSVVAAALDALTDDYAHERMLYGEAVSTDAIRNCLKLLKQWNVISIYTEGKDRHIRICPEYEREDKMEEVRQIIYQFNMATPLLDFKSNCD